MLDLIIIGAGPAGITAAVYAARKRINFIVITKDIGGQAASSGDIQNYTGYQFITGPELTAKFYEHIKQYNIEVKEGEEVADLRKNGDAVAIRTDKATYEARAAIIASGKRSKELGIPGETEFKNRGISYCVTCDGPLFAQKDVAIIGGGNSSLDAALQLMKIARHIYIVNMDSELTGDAVMKEKVESARNVTIANGTKVTAVIGENLVTGIKVKKGEGEKVIPVQGVFVEIGLSPNSGLAADVERNESGEIKVDSFNRTNIPGIFAAGDVTDVPEKQIIIAAGEGAKAALSVFRYLSQKR